MKYVKSGVEHVPTGWREYVSFKERIEDADGTTREVWKKKRRKSPVEYVGTRGGKPSQRSRKAAEESARAWMDELNAAEADRQRRGDVAMTRRASSVADYMDGYVSRLVARGSVETSTAMGYRDSVKYVREGLSEYTVESLTANAVDAWVTDLLGRGLSNSTVGKAFRVLRQGLSEAVAQKVIDENPTDAVKPPRRANTKPGINALDSQGVADLLERLDSMPLSTVTVAAHIALFTGLRQGEVCGLQWRDLDPFGCVIWVRRSIGREKGGCYVKETKTGKVRDAAMPGALVALLQRWSEQLTAERGERPRPDDYILPNVDGGYTQPPYIGHQWATLSKSFGILGTEGRPVTFHDLRHTWATLAVSNGMDIKTVSSNLGHSNAAMTLNIYASADPDAKRRAANLMEKVLAGAIDVTNDPSTKVEG